MFPGAGARIFRNEEGEVLGWDYPLDDERPEPDDEEYGYPEDWCSECGHFVDDVDHEH